MRRNIAKPSFKLLTSKSQYPKQRRQFSKTLVTRKIDYTNLGINLTFLIPITTVLLRLWWNQRHQNLKKLETEEREKFTVLQNAADCAEQARDCVLRGDLSKAEKLFVEALGLREDTFLPPNDLIIIQNKEDIADVCFARGKFNMAQKYYIQSIASRMTIIWNEDPEDVKEHLLDIGRDHLQVAQCFRKLKKTKESLEHFDKAKAIYKNDPVQSSVVNVMMAELYRQKLEFEKAEELLKDALKTFEKHPSVIDYTGTTYYLLGRLYGDIATHKKDLELFNVAVEYFKKSKQKLYNPTLDMKDQSTDYAKSCMKMGSYLLRKYDLLRMQNVNNVHDSEMDQVLDEAEETLRESEKVLRDVYQESNPYLVSKCLYELGRLCERQHNYKEASYYYEDSAEMRKKELETEMHNLVADGLMQAGKMSMYSGNHKDAERQLCKARDIFRSLAMHKEFAMALYNLSYVYSRTGDYYAALESLELAVRYCDDIQLYCLVYANMVMVLNKMSRFRKAIGAYKECMKMFPDLTVHHLPLLLNVAASHYERAQYLECKKLLDTCKDIIDKEIVEVNHWRGVQCLRSGRLNNKLGYYKLAERQLLQAYDIFTKLYKGGVKSHDSSSECLITLAKVYFNKASIWPEKRSEYLFQAQAYIQRVARMRKRAFGKNANEIAEVNDFIGMAYFVVQKRYTEALERIKTALTKRREQTISEGYDHPDYAKSIAHEAILLSNLGASDSEVLEKLELSVMIGESTLGKFHPDYADLLMNMATFRIDKGQFDIAKDLCKQALAIYKEVYSFLDFAHPKIFMTLKRLADLYSRGGEADRELYQQTILEAESLRGQYEKLQL